MIKIRDIRDWRDQNVTDESGAKIGSLEAVYFDTATDEPTFASVKTGLPGRHRLVFVPLIGAVVSPDAVITTVDKKLAKDAPSIDTDGELESKDEPALYQHYGLDYQPGSGGERRLGRR